MRNLGIFFTVVIAGLLLASCGGTAAIDASKLYSNSCALCHGPNREGVENIGPALTPDSLAALSDTEIKDTILDGRLDTGMLPFMDVLNAEEIDALAQFIKYTSP